MIDDNAKIIIERQLRRINEDVQWVKVKQRATILRALLMISNLIGDETEGDRELKRKINALINCLCFNRLDQINLFVTDLEYLGRCLKEAGYLPLVEERDDE